MGLGLSVSNGGGEFTPFCKYDARAGRLFRVDRTQNNGVYESNDVDITSDASFIADLANIKVGWINYTTQGPVKLLSVLGKAAIPPRPSDVNAEGKPAFRQGFEIMILLSKASGGGPARSLSSAAGCVIEAMDGLHDAYSAAPEAKAGKLPVVKITKTVPIKSGQSTNYKPILEIASWVDRPEGLPADGAPVASAPAATGSTQVSAPVSTQVSAPQPATVSADDFG